MDSLRRATVRLLKNGLMIRTMSPITAYDRNLLTSTDEGRSLDLLPHAGLG